MPDRAPSDRSPNGTTDVRRIRRNSAQSSQNSLYFDARRWQLLEFDGKDCGFWVATDCPVFAGTGGNHDSFDATDVDHRVRGRGSNLSKLVRARCRSGARPLASAPASTEVVLATPASPLAPGPAATTSAPQGEAGAASDATTQKIAEVSKKVQQSLALGRPRGLTQWIANLSQKKKYRIGYTKLAERILAEGVATRQVAKAAATRGFNDPQTLSASSLNAALDSLADEDVTTIINERFANLTGLKVPEDKQGLLEHIKKQNAQAQRVLSTRRQAPRTLALAPMNVPTKDMTAFNWTQPGFSANSTGIVTAVQDQNKFNNCKPGSCWAFATVGAFEAAYAKANGVLIGASEQYLLSCAQPVLSQSSDPILRVQPWTCAGGWWAFPMLSSSDVTNPGLPLRVNLPFTGNPDPCPANVDKPYQANTWGYVTDGLSIPTNDVLKAALCEHGPLAVAIFADPAWFFNEGDVINDSANQVTNPQVNHAVVLVGWDNNKGAWMIKNSWGTGFGIQVNGIGTGFLYIAYNTSNLGFSAAFVVAAPPQ